MSEILHVVLASSGEYSERTVSVAGIFRDEATARRLAEEGTTHKRLDSQARDAWRKVWNKQAIVRHSGGGLFYVWSPGPEYDGVDTSAEEAAWRAAFEKTYGPEPPDAEVNDYTVVAAPLDQWGKFGEF